MRHLKTAIAGLAVAMLVSTGAFAGTDLNEVGAFLVFPMIASLDDGTETFVTITNSFPQPLRAHVSFINGEKDHEFECYECDFAVDLTGNDTETLVISKEMGRTRIKGLDSGLNVTCDWLYGMLVVALEEWDDVNNEYVTVTDNVLLGEEVVVNYANGWAYSVPAVPFQGKTANAGAASRSYAFDDVEYAKLPSVIAADYLAPNIAQGNSNVYLALFTLGFTRQFPPEVDCSIQGFDAHENSVSGSFKFGCWGMVDICNINPEYCFPNLGVFTERNEHGWLQLDCKVNVDNNPNTSMPGDINGFDANGGVHGAVIQYQAKNSFLGDPLKMRKFMQTAAWARLLYQSVTTGDPVTLHLENQGGSMGG